jgi:multidrug efflux pump subunit AcrA (membrane-fusion protein)
MCITATGSVVAWHEITVGMEADGLATIEIAVDEGDLVAKCQILARPNPASQVSALPKEYTETARCQLPHIG